MFQLALLIPIAACAAVGGGAAEEVRYGCSIGPWNSILRSIPAVQDLVKKERGSDVAFRDAEQPSCTGRFESDTAILGYMPDIHQSILETFPGFETLCVVTTLIDEVGLVLTKHNRDIDELLVSVLEMPQILIIHKPTGEGFPVEFRARGSLYTLRGTIQGDGKKTWAHVNTGNLKFGSSFGKVYPGRTEKNVKPNAPINKETQILIYGAETVSDPDADFIPVRSLKKSLSGKVDSLLPQVLSKTAGFKGFGAEAGKKMAKLYEKCKRDYFERESTFHHDWQMVRLNSLSNCMTRAFNDMGMWIKPASYRETHPDVPTLFINHDENCFLTTALTAFVHGLPPALVDSFIASSTDAGLRVALQVLVRKARNGSAAEDLHDVRVAMGERFKWCDSCGPYSVIKRLREMMPKFNDLSNLFRWRTDLADSSVQDNIGEARGRELIMSRFSSAPIEPKRVVFIAVEAVASGVEPNMRFKSNSLVYDLAASVDHNSANSHFTVNVRVASQETPGTYKWFKIDNHVPWQISPPEPYPWPEYSGGALVEVPPVLNYDTQFLMYVLREQGDSKQARSSVSSLSAADASAEK